MRIMNLSFFVVNFLVLLTVIISKLNLSFSEEGWLLGWITAVSYLILPWFFYWFISNYDNFLANDKKLIITRFQLVSLVITILISLTPLVVPSLIYNAKVVANSTPNWVYAWQLEVAQFLFWILFAVIAINSQFNLSTKKLDDYNKKFIRRINISAILVFSIPVVFAISTPFILMSLLFYILAYWIVYDGLKKYYESATTN